MTTVVILAAGPGKRLGNKTNQYFVLNEGYGFNEDILDKQSYRSMMMSYKGFTV